MRQRGVNLRGWVSLISVAEKCCAVQGQRYTEFCRHCSFQLWSVTARVMINGMVINGDSRKVYYSEGLVQRLYSVWITEGLQRDQEGIYRIFSSGLRFHSFLKSCLLWTLCKWTLGNKCVAHNFFVNYAGFLFPPIGFVHVYSV